MDTSSSAKLSENCDFNRLKNFPISFLAICLEMTGFTLTWQKAEHIFELPFVISNILLYITEALSIAIILIYTAKIFKHPAAVRAEFNNPIKLIFSHSRQIVYHRQHRLPEWQYGSIKNIVVGGRGDSVDFYDCDYVRLDSARKVRDSPYESLLVHSGGGLLTNSGRRRKNISRRSYPGFSLVLAFSGGSF